MSLEDDLSRLKKLTREPRNEEDFKKTVEALNTQSDLAVVLICSVLLEEAVESLLRAYMVELNSDDSNALFRGSGSLASLSAKTKVAFALGLIGKKTRKNIDLIREIRNAMAHSRKSLSFSTEEVNAVCQRLDHGSMMSQGPPEQLKSIVSNPRTAFVMMSMILWSVLQHAHPTSPATARLP